MPRRVTGPPLVRYLSKCGAATRNGARELVRAGRVTLNGAVCTDGAVRVDPARDAVLVDGTPVRLDEARRGFVWLALNKPRGVVSTTNDPEGRATVLDLVPPPHAPGLAPVGRLDRASAGLLLLTNDTEGAARLLDPAQRVPRTYRVKVRGVPGDATLARWRTEPLETDGLVLAPMQVEVASVAARSAWLTITLLEGRNREIRRRCEAEGHEVLVLLRTSFGPVALGDLAPGALRPLTSRELAALGGAAPGRRPRASM